MKTITRIYTFDAVRLAHLVMLNDSSLKVFCNDLHDAQAAITIMKNEGARGIIIDASALPPDVAILVLPVLCGMLFQSNIVWRIGGIPKGSFGMFDYRFWEIFSHYYCSSLEDAEKAITDHYKSLRSVLSSARE